MLNEVPAISSRLTYVVDGDRVWSFHSHPDGVQIHANLPAHTRGKEAVRSARRAFEWAIETFHVERVYAGIEKSNRPAWFLASQAGMRFLREQDGMRWYVYEHR